MNERMRLRVLHTNDIHSHFEQMPRIASVLRRLRAEAGEERTLTLDIGDHIDRMRPETEGTDGRTNIAVLNASGYEAVTLGNNEGLSYTQDVLSELYGRQASFTTVICNLPASATGELPPWAVPYHIVRKAGLRIGLIGVTACFPEFYNLLGWDVREPFDVVPPLVRQLRPQVDVLIVMSHLGLRNDERMAAEVPGIDLILGGHTHHLLEEPLRVGGTLVCATGKFGQYVGVVDLEWDPAEQRVAHAEASVQAVAIEPEDEEIRSLIREYGSRAASELDREVARLPVELPFDWYGESPLGNLLAGGLRRWMGAEIGLVNAGQLLGGLPQGPVSAGMLLQLCPSPINPCRMRLTGTQLLRALEESLLPEFMDKPLYGYGFRGKVLGTLCVDGLTVQYDPEGADYAKIRAVDVGGKPLEAEREYLVGTIDMFTFRIGFTSLGEGTEPQFFLPEFLRDVLLRELRDEASLHHSFSRRWRTVGESPHNT
ncbi:bifunctional UDP-sugar hydrolase/5'-nucleotidase [Paenibacillus ehimensis]|nr:bifunctional UDP-sugar hydrolase/5'-nucleotidase [Paenibacillus ehimensis]MEC0210766.1 bifunctional UDP-sugar hydrolase/5'-nucleotidase [Paenibacillus ehimensis]